MLAVFNEMEIANLPLEQRESYEKAKSDRKAWDDELERKLKEEFDKGSRQGRNEGFKSDLCRTFSKLLKSYEKSDRKEDIENLNKLQEKLLEVYQEEMPFKKSQEEKILQESQQEKTSDEDQNKNIDGGYETGATGEELVGIMVKEVTRDKNAKDTESDLGKSQDRVTNEKLQQTFIENADNLLSIHQTTNNTQEVASTMEESPQEMTGVLKQTMISLQKLMSELNQIEENSKRVEKENQEMKRVINQLEEKSKRMEKENQEMKKEIQKMKEKIENQSEMKK
jgi:hypothetical protein